MSLMREREIEEEEEMQEQKKCRSRTSTGTESPSGISGGDCQCHPTKWEASSEMKNDDDFWSPKEKGRFGKNWDCVNQSRI